jgi:hypothetical protein
MAEHSPTTPELQRALLAHADRELSELERQPAGECDLERMIRAARTVRVAASLSFVERGTEA